MLITYPVTYERRYLLNNGRRPVSRKVSEADEIDIPEVGSVEAPVAASWRAGPEASATDEHVRLFDGHLYTPFRIARSDAPEIEDVVAQICGAGDQDRLPSANEINRVLGDTRDIMFDYRREKLALFIIVDDVVYSRCSVPRLQLKVLNGTPKVEVAFQRNRPEHCPPLDEDLSPLTAFDQVYERMTEQPGPIHRHVHDLAVWLPAAFEYDRSTDLAGRAVGQAIQDNYRDIHTWPSDAAREFLDIREAHDRWVADQDGEDAIALLDRAYGLFTGQNLYVTTHAAAFFEAYDRVQTLIPDMNISLAHVPTR